MKVNYEFIEPGKKGSSVQIKLTESEQNHSGWLYVDLRPFFDFNPAFSGTVAFDFFMVSTIVYGIDNLLERYIYSSDGWTREIEFTFPVLNKSIWELAKSDLEKTLCFLTGDEWKIGFEDMRYNGQFYWNNEKRRHYPSFNQANTNFNAVSLFSGGLDSLIGIVDYFATNPHKKLLLVSHYDSNSGGPNADQHRLLKKFNQKYPDNYKWIQTGVSLQLDSKKREPSYRSRSLMFIALGTYFASKYQNGITLYIPENGTISLNYPLSPSRRSSLSTRTTHPYMLALLRKVLHTVGIKVNLENPYEELTKGQMLVNSRDQPFIINAFTDSVSCGKRGRKSHWDNRDGNHHCGVCMPCIYRRAALNQIGLDQERYGIDLFNPVKGLEYVLNLPDISALIDYIKTPLDKKHIEANLLINGSLAFEKLSTYASVVLKTREEIKQWVLAKADNKTKREFGL